MSTCVLYLKSTWQNQLLFPLMWDGIHAYSSWPQYHSGLLYLRGLVSVIIPTGQSIISVTIYTCTTYQISHTKMHNKKYRVYNVVFKHNLKFFSCFHAFHNTCNLIKLYLLLLRSRGQILASICLSNLLDGFRQPE